MLIVVVRPGRCGKQLNTSPPPILVTGGNYTPVLFFFSSRRRHTRCSRDRSSDVCSSDLRPRRSTDTRCSLPLAANERELGGGEQRVSVLRRGLALPAPRMRNGPYHPRRRQSHYPQRLRSEERRVGKECRSRWSPSH